MAKKNNLKHQTFYSNDSLFKYAVISNQHQDAKPTKRQQHERMFKPPFANHSLQLSANVKQHKASQNTAFAA